MGNLVYNWAKTYVEKRDKEKKEKIESQETKRKIEREQFRAIIDEFRKKYIEQVVAEFKETTMPIFDVGDIVVTNWYGEGSSWDGNMRMLQAHTPFKGPIDVEITQVVLDFSEIAEIIYTLDERDEFRNKYTSLDYTTFKSIVDGHRKKYDISWAYMIKVPGDENTYWRYSFRENKLLQRKHEVAKWSKKCYANELESIRLREEKEKLDQKIKKQLEKITNNVIIVR